TELLGRIRPGDIVLLHDPQTAGLAGPLARAGAQVVWRSHIGVDWENDATRAGWDFLRPYLGPAEGYVFTGRQYVPSWLPDDKVSIIPPSIDPFSPKNQNLDAATVQAILVKLGVLDDGAPQVPARFVRRNGDMDTVTRQAVITGEGRPGAGDPVLLQVSRWDRLKDMAGGLRGLAGHLRADAGGDAMPGRPVGRRGVRRPGRRGRVRGMPAAMARPAARGPGAHPAGDAATGGHRRERGHGQRPATARHRHRAKEPGRGLRADRVRGDVEGPAGDRLGGRRDHRPDPRGHRHPPARSHRPASLRAGPPPAPRRPGRGNPAGTGRARLRPRPLPRGHPPTALREPAHLTRLQRLIPGAGPRACCAADSLDAECLLACGVPGNGRRQARWEGGWKSVAEAELSFATLLRRLRAGAGLTQEELAEAAGISPRSVSDLESGLGRRITRGGAKAAAWWRGGALGGGGGGGALFRGAGGGGAPAADVLAAGNGAAGNGAGTRGAGAVAATRTLPRDVGSFTGRE